MAIKDLSLVRNHLFICNGGSCLNAGAEESTKAIRSCIAEAGLDTEIHTTKTLCNGRCEDAPVVIIMPDNIWYKKMTSEKASILVEEHLLRRKIVEEHLLFDYSTLKISQDE